MDFCRGCVFSGTTREADKRHYSLSAGILEAVRSVRNQCQEEEVCLPRSENPPLCLKSVGTVEGRAGSAAGVGEQVSETGKSADADLARDLEKDDSVTNGVEQADGIKGGTRLDVDSVVEKLEPADVGHGTKGGGDSVVDDDDDDEQRRVDDEQRSRDFDDDVTDPKPGVSRSPREPSGTTSDSGTRQPSKEADTTSDTRRGGIRRPWEEVDSVSGDVPLSDATSRGRTGGLGDNVSPKQYPWQEVTDGAGSEASNSEPVTAYLTLESGEEVTVESDSDRVRGDIGSCHSFEVNTHDRLLRYHSNTGTEVSEVNLEEATGHVKLTIRHLGAYIMVAVQYAVSNGSRSLFYVSPDSRCRQTEELVFHDLAIGASLTRSAATLANTAGFGSRTRHSRGSQSR